MPRKSLPLDVYLEQRIDRSGDCWLWTGPRDHNGYGQVRGSSGRRQAHRLVWERNYGPVPAGKELDHLCRNRACVRSDHLEVVDHRENMLRGDTITATHSQQLTCIRGHPFDRIRSTGERLCRTCDAERSRAYRERKRMNTVTISKDAYDAMREVCRLLDEARRMDARAPAARRARIAAAMGKVKAALAAAEGKVE